ncbi:uncharacterized protein LOC121188117 [Toxotes jaculatrix]|uniref:uncharacterized protein LOC121188117 n=1 Tax=Toxotes jaculatrix TaxID=941984 RepID=UPI001B3AE6EB|nr:uncharacterized protein LOC121188117 [Toxotes jaculatrix]
MWCYQKPGFESLLLAELQRQQQCNQFCDTLLSAEGVSVPAHSCILSAISPLVSSTLSSTPASLAGQSRLLQFRPLSGSALLHMVRLLYSGEMAGEGEKEKQEAISAAAKLGIHGLVEVTKKGRKSRNEEGGGQQHTEVGVQTEPQEMEGRRGKWRREVRDGSTFLWKETHPDVDQDMWTQTEELQVNITPDTQSAASVETTEVALEQTDSCLVPPKIPYIPISLIYPPDVNQTPQPSSAPGASVQDTTAAGHTSVSVVAPPYASAPPSQLPFSTQMTPCATDPQSWWTGLQGAARDVVEGEEWDNGWIEQFQGNIPGFISYFLNPDKVEGLCRGRARRRRGAGVGGARRAGTGERRARRPRARTGGRGRGGLMQTVDVQEVGVSKLQKLFLQRWGTRTSRTGQGGGAAGRKLYVKTRELLMSAKSYQGRRRRCKAWEFSHMSHSEGGGGNMQHGRRSARQPFKQDSLLVGMDKSATSVSFSSTPVQIYNIHHTLPASNPSLQPSPSPILQSSAASYVPPAPSLLHTTSLPPPAPPPHEDQPEHIDRLLEEVMMGLDILPKNNNSGVPHSQPPLPASSSSSTQVVAVARGASGANGEVAILQQQGEGELNKILDHFLQSFEQHVDSCSAREEQQMDGESSTEAYTVLNKYRKANTLTKTPHLPHLQNTHIPRPVTRCQTTELQRSDKTKTPPSRSQTRRASAHTAVAPKHAEGTAGKVKVPATRLNKRRRSQYQFSLERKGMRVRKPVSTSDTKTKILHDRGDKQLQQMPVVKLERSGLLPVRVTLQQHSCQSVEVKSPAKRKTRSSSVKYPCGSLSEKNQQVLCCTKTYPIRSRFREEHVMKSLPFLVEPLVSEQPPTAGQTGSRQDRAKKNGQLIGVPPIQLQPVEPCGKNEQLEKNEITVQPREEAQGPRRTGRKRRADSGKETIDDVAKKVCSEQMAQPSSETCKPISDSADIVSEQATAEAEDVIDVETVSLSSAGECLQKEEQEEKTTWREIKLRETEESGEGSSDEIIDVDGDTDGTTDLEKRTDEGREQSENGPCQSGTAASLSRFVPPLAPSAKDISAGSKGSWEDEDIDVIGGSSPVPDPVIISWTESSEGEEEDGDEDVDVVGEKTDYSSFATMNRGKLDNRKFKTEVLLH